MMHPVARVPISAQPPASGVPKTECTAQGGVPRVSLAPLLYRWPKAHNCASWRYTIPAEANPRRPAKCLVFKPLLI